MSLIPEVSQKRKKRESEPAKPYIICELPSEFNDAYSFSTSIEATLPFSPGSEDTFQSTINVPHRVMSLRLPKSKEEKKKARRMYRREYVTRPKVMEKIKKRLNDPLVIQARKEYSERPEVKSQKQFLSKRGRLIKNLLKEKHSDIYYGFINDLSDKNLISRVQ